jgi:oxygen-independent coproporphyrinogen-3 oxidase
MEKDGGIFRVQKCQNAVAGSELISKESELDEYVMLALRSSGLNVQEFESRFGTKWLEEKKSYLQKLRESDFLMITENKINLTKKGFAVCDEILANIP